MKKIIIIIAILSINNYVSGQWVNLGIQGNQVQMIENSHGYKYKNTPGQTPASGITYEIKSTLSDWQNDVTTNTGGGGDYGCCAISNLYFMNISTGIRSKSYQGFYSFQKTNDNGFTWSTFANGINFSPISLVMVNDTTGYISGNSYGYNHGQLYKLTPTASIQLFDWDTLFITNANIEFPNSNSGFVIMKDTNQNSYLFRTNNSGGNWDKVFSAFKNNLTSVSFPDSLTGYLCSNNGEIHKTIDGGNSWLQIVSPTTKKINSVDFINDSVGYIVCDSGEIYRTIDGALSWSNESSGTTSNIIKVQMVDTNTAYCISNEGTLFKNDNVLSVDFSSDNSTSSMIIYPNPASESISISLPNGLIIKNAEFFDTHGNLVLLEDHNEIDISSLDSGMYLIRIYSNKKVYTSKFIKY